MSFQKLSFKTWISIVFDVQTYCAIRACWRNMSFLEYFAKMVLPHHRENPHLEITYSITEYNSQYNKQHKQYDPFLIWNLFLIYKQKLLKECEHQQECEKIPKFLNLLFWFCHRLGSGSATSSHFMVYIDYNRMIHLINLNWDSVLYLEGKRTERFLALKSVK